MTRVLATDLDGTVLFANEVHEADARALARWRREGNLVIASTARPMSRALQGLQRLADAAGEGRPVHDYVVCATGGVVVRGDSEILRAAELTPEALGTVLDFFGQRDDVSVTVHTLSESYVVHDPIDFSAERRRRGQRFAEMPLGEARDLTATTVSVRVTGEEQAARLEPLLDEQLAGSAAVSRSVGFIDVAPAGATKARGLTWLLDRLREEGTRIEQLVAVGDSLNDVSMFELADSAWAMSAATAEVASHADGTVESVGELIERLLAAQ